MEIEYKIGDATDQGEECAIIMHICNNKGAWGAGFVIALSKKWPEPEAQYRGLENYDLGQGYLVGLEDSDHLVYNMIAQDGFGGVAVNYDALRRCLQDFRFYCGWRFYSNTNSAVVMPRIGCGLGGGDWEVVSAIIKEELTDYDIPVIVYDLPQQVTA